MDYLVKWKAIVGLGAVCISTIAAIVDCKKAIDEEKRISEQSARATAKISKHFEETNAMLFDMLRSDLMAMPKKEAEVDTSKIEKLFRMAPDKKREIPIEKVREIIATYGITMEDFKRDFPEAIII